MPLSNGGGKRDDRLHEDEPDDFRKRAERDRDLILYSPEFRRLAGVTQVVAAEEGHVFHNRLTHSLEVAQVSRRIAEKLTREFPQETKDLIDPDVVEAAALAHDLGHPPFGHVAETELNKLVTHEAGLLDGFEGNAQSLRIITKLAQQSYRPQRGPERKEIGLNLTRATLNATLKYPWLRATGGEQQHKWGAYQSEEEELTWARKMEPPGSTAKSPEAAVMDWADDITYAVHDVTDFYRAGLIPLDKLAPAKNGVERKRFCEEVFLQIRGKSLNYTEAELESTVESIVRYFPLDERYQGTRKQRGILQSFASNLTNRYVSAVQFSHPGGGSISISRNPELEKEIFMWKQMTWHYVIRNPALATQQFGQRKIIRDLFSIFFDAAKNKQFELIPAEFREQLILGEAGMTARIIADLIAGLSERQAVVLHRRLTGVAMGSVLDRVDLN